MTREFWRRVFFGDLDREGYTPNERKRGQR